MTKQENIDDPNSCWNKAEPDEPIFILRANDMAAPELVLWWASGYITRKCHRLTEEVWAKYRDALSIADKMKNWKFSRMWKMAEKCIGIVKDKDAAP